MGDQDRVNIDGVPPFDVMLGAADNLLEIKLEVENTMLLILSDVAKFSDSKLWTIRYETKNDRGRDLLDNLSTWKYLEEKVIQLLNPTDLMKLDCPLWRERSYSKGQLVKVLISLKKKCIPLMIEMRKA